MDEVDRAMDEMDRAMDEMDRAMDEETARAAAAKEGLTIVPMPGSIRPRLASR